MPLGENKKVAIVGYAESSRDLAPYDDPTFDIWDCNAVSRATGRRKDAIFFLDKRKEIPMDQIAWLQEQECPVFMQKQWDDIPASRAFPFRDFFALQSREPETTDRFASSSIQYMFLFAVLQGYEEIHVYGVEMHHDSEWAYQAKGMCYAMGIAVGIQRARENPDLAPKGITVHLPENCTLMDSGWVYALEDAPQIDGVISGGYLRQFAEDWTGKVNAVIAERQRAEGRLEQIRNPMDEAAVKSLIVDKTKAEERGKGGTAVLAMMNKDYAQMARWAWGMGDPGVING